MSEKERLAKLKFLMKWEQPKEETERKKNLIKQEITHLESIRPLYEEYFQTKRMKGMIAMCFSAARLPMVNDTMLIDFVKGLSLIPFAKDELQWKEIDSLLNPVTDFLNEFLSTDVFLNNIIDKEISGDEILKLKNIDVPLSKEAIRLHIKRKGFLPITPEDVAKIQQDLVKYKLEQFDDGTDKKVMSIMQERVVEQLEVHSICESQVESVNPTKSEKLKTRLSEYGFFELDVIKKLNKSQIDTLISKLAENDLPYQIAMLYYLDFIRYIWKNHGKLVEDKYKILSYILETGERTTKGNILVLNKNSKEDKTRYTSWNLLEETKADFFKIQKLGV